MEEEGEASRRVTLLFHSRHLYEEAKGQQERKLSKQAALDRSISEQRQVRSNRKSGQLVEQKKTKQLQEVFLLLDSDRDGLISAQHIDISSLHTHLLEIITPLLIEMELKAHTLDQDDFLKGGLQLLQSLTPP